MPEFIDRKTVAEAVTLVARGSEVLEFEALGMADIEPVTAIGIMMLAEEGKLTLRDL
jgi:hypothetical protein